LNNLVIGSSSEIAKELSKKMDIIAVSREEFDIKNLDKIDGFVKDIVKKYGKLDNLIYIAGIQNIKPLRVMKIEEIKEIFDINFFGAMMFAKAFASKRISNPNSSITFISSIAGLEAEIGVLAYSASKAALNNLIQGLAKEISPIRVNGIAPGFMKTKMTKVYTDEFVEEIQKKSPLGLVTPKDISEVIEFLINNKKITGEIIRIDGGYK
jgi:NAD(P)-dependent dehydrogenase (short-subunit alcohol dehydrogenase family)